MDRLLEPISPLHKPILDAAILEGIDVSPVVGGAERYMGYGETKYGYGPCCILDMIKTDYVIEPHIIWMPWIKNAHRIGHFKWAMETMSKDHQVLLNIEKSQIKFFEHFVKKGILRKIGHINKLPIVEEIHMYQYIKE